MILDVHTHRPAPGAIVNVDPVDPVTLDPQYLYSVGLHPWNSDRVTPEALARLDSLAADSAVVAIGETGLDALRGADIATQQQLFDHHVELSESLRRPLIIHAVKTFPLIIASRRRHNPAMPWIIHGFRGKPQLAEELLRHGFYLSVGARVNPSSLAVIPPDRLLAETDDSPFSISAILSAIPVDSSVLSANASRLFPLSDVNIDRDNK